MHHTWGFSPGPGSSGLFVASLARHLPCHYSAEACTSVLTACSTCSAVSRGELRPLYLLIASPCCARGFSIGLKVMLPAPKHHTPALRRWWTLIALTYLWRDTPDTKAHAPSLRWQGSGKANYCLISILLLCLLFDYE